MASICAMPNILKSQSLKVEGKELHESCDLSDEDEEEGDVTHDPQG
jgi:hypothetical protein